MTVDIISKDRYNCSNTIDDKKGIPKGHVLPGVYKKDLLKNSNELMPGNIYTKIGQVPRSLMGKEVEGNLVILNGPYICYYTNFVDIDRSVWNLLPMGLFVDSLLNESFDLRGCSFLIQYVCGFGWVIAWHTFAFRTFEST